MILHAQVGTGNLGDFSNCLPVLSGIYKEYGKIFLIIQNDMKRFNGIKEFLICQEMFDNVVFEDEVAEINSPVFGFNSWIACGKLNSIRPIETCKYETLFKTHYGMKFETDDSFILNVPDIGVPVIDDILLGDRCDITTVDKRRKSGLLKSSGKFDGVYLNYSNTILYNLNLIKKAKNKIITTVTGISVLVDLMDIEQEVYYDNAINVWDNRSSIQETFDHHYYANRNSKMVYLGN